MIVSGRGVSIVPAIEEIKINIGQKNTQPIAVGQSHETYQVTFNGTITEWRITGYPEGSIEVDILKAYQDIPASYQSITGTNPPSLSSQRLNNSTDVATWDTELKPGDVLAVNILSATTVEHVVITLCIIQ